MSYDAILSAEVAFVKQRCSRGARSALLPVRSTKDRHEVDEKGDRGQAQLVGIARAYVICGADRWIWFDSPQITWWIPVGWGCV